MVLALPSRSTLPALPSFSPSLKSNHPPHTPSHLQPVNILLHPALPSPPCLPSCYTRLQPANILLDDYQNAKISDFGLARCKFKTYLETRLDAGTVAYM